MSITITNGTKHIELIDTEDEGLIWRGESKKITISKSDSNSTPQLTKGEASVVIRNEWKDIILTFENVSSPSEESNSALYETIKGYFFS